VGLYLFHNTQRALDAGTGPYFYLPKIEGHLEARWFNEVFTWSEQRLGIPHGSIKATVLIETILAAFEMEEIIHELPDHMAGLNAGRWDYMFSAIKKFHHDPDFLWPDRSQVMMTVPMMRAYTELMVRTCHKRGAHAIGGMAAFIPSRKDAEINPTAFAKVREDNDGFDGSICLVHKPTKTLTFAGARSGIFILPTNGQAVEVKGNRKSVGGSRTPLDYPFDTHEFNIEDQIVVMLSDGILDVMGEEPTPVLFGKDRFLKTLSLWNDHDPGRIINNVQVALDNHRGTQPLRDDMTLVAFRLN